MSTHFDDLSEEGKIAKIEQHIGGGHPVVSPWVIWVLERFVPGGADADSGTPLVSTAFHDLGDDDKLVKIRQGLRNGMIPAPWVDWLLSEFVPSTDRTPSTQSSAAHLPR